MMLIGRPLADVQAPLYSLPQHFQLRRLQRFHFGHLLGPEVLIEVDHQLAASIVADGP